MEEIWVGRNDRWPEAVSDGLTLPCSSCGQVPHFDYRVTDWVWREVVPTAWRLGVVCLPCLDKMASVRGIDVSGQVENVQFTGVGKTIVLVPQRIIRYAVRRRPQ